MVHSYTSDLGGPLTSDLSAVLVDDYGHGLATDLGGPLADDRGYILVDDFGNVIIIGGDVLPLAAVADVSRSTGDYGQALLNLLPMGVAWPRDEDSALVKVVRALSGTWQRIELRAQDLLTESAAGSNLVEMLPEWEAAEGLPDPCAGQLPTIALRQNAVRARLAARGGQSIPYFVSVAAALGVTITVTEFKPFCAGDPCGRPCYGQGWADAWQVNAPTTRVRYFLAGEGRAGDPLASWGDQSLECVLNRIKPAHTVLLFSYS